MGVVDGVPVGYMFSHPARLTSPPALNKLLEDDDGVTDHDCYFIHDVAVLRSHRGMGVARGLVAKALLVAAAGGHAVVALVSVQNSRGYWRWLGFEPFEESQETLKYVADFYGAEACYMVRRIV